MNKPEMLKFADDLENVPEPTFDMAYWVSDKNWQSNPEFGVTPITWRTMCVPDCGAAACMAGWKPLFDGLTVQDVFVLETKEHVSCYTRRVLELTNQEKNILFFAGAWPREFQNLNEHYQPNPTAKHAAAFIRWFCVEENYRTLISEDYVRSN